MQNEIGPKKSLYVFFTALLGMLLFLILDRIVIFLMLYLAIGGYISPAVSYGQFLFLDYFTMTIIMMLGGWYGIWLGLYWYRLVYEDRTHMGFVHHVATHYFPPRQRPAYAQRVAELKGRLQSDLDKLDNLIDEQKPAISQFEQPAPIRRTVVRRRAPKKLGESDKLKPKARSTLTEQEAQMEE